MVYCSWRAASFVTSLAETFGTFFFLVCLLTQYKLRGLMNILGAIDYTPYWSTPPLKERVTDWQAERFAKVAVRLNTTERSCVP